MTVKCPDGFSNQGSETITCQNGIHYKFDVQPRCEAKGRDWGGDNHFFVFFVFFVKVEVKF